MAGILVNGTPRDLEGVPLHTNALDFLRGCGLTGAKEGCAEGECGACSVLVARPAPDGSDATEWTAINSCLVPAATLDGQEVVTVRGPRRARVAAPGPARDGGARRVAVRLLHAGVRVQHGRRVLPLRAVRPPTARLPTTTATTATTASTCTPSAATCAAAPATGRSRTRRSRSASPPRATRWPPGVRRPHRRPPRPGLDDGEATFVRPATLADALRVLREDPDAVVVAGSTDWGVEVNLKGVRAPAVVAVDRLDELRGFTVSDSADGGEIRIGAALTLTEVERRLGGPAADPGRADAAVRLAADPQRRHARRQPRHRLADRGRPAGAAGPRGVLGARVGGRGADGRPRGLLHRLPRVGPGARAS